MRCGATHQARRNQPNGARAVVCRRPQGGPRICISGEKAFWTSVGPATGHMRRHCQYVRTATRSSGGEISRLGIRLRMSHLRYTGRGEQFGVWERHSGVHRYLVTPNGCHSSRVPARGCMRYPCYPGRGTVASWDSEDSRFTRNDSVSVPARVRVVASDNLSSRRGGVVDDTRCRVPVTLKSYCTSMVVPRGRSVCRF
jgi:hypothetical protein